MQGGSYDTTSTATAAPGSPVWAEREAWHARLRGRLLSWETVLALFTVALLLVAVATTPGFGDQIQPRVIPVEDGRQGTARPSARAPDHRPGDRHLRRQYRRRWRHRHGHGHACRRRHPLAILAALLPVAVCGAFNAFFVTLGLPSLIVTLGTLAMFRGLCYVLVGGTPVSEVPQWLLDYSFLDLPGTYIPYSLVPFLLLAAWSGSCCTAPPSAGGVRHRREPGAGSLRRCARTRARSRCSSLRVWSRHWLASCTPASIPRPHRTDARLRA